MEDKRAINLATELLTIGPLTVSIFADYLYPSRESVEKKSAEVLFELQKQGKVVSHKEDNGQVIYELRSL